MKNNNADTVFYCAKLKEHITFRGCIRRFNARFPLACNGCITGQDNQAEYNTEQKNSNTKIAKKRGPKPKTKSIKITDRSTDTASKTPKDNNLIYIDFTGHEDLLKSIKKLAEEEVRTLNEQIIYSVKKYMKITGTGRKMAKLNLDE